MHPGSEKLEAGSEAGNAGKERWRMVRAWALATRGCHPKPPRRSLDDFKGLVNLLCNEFVLVL